MNVLLALGTVPTIVVGLVIGLVVAAAVFGLVFLLCVLPDIKKNKKADKEPAVQTEPVSEAVNGEDAAEAEEESAEEEAEEAVEVLEEKTDGINEETAEEEAVTEEASEEVAGETVEEETAEVTETVVEDTAEAEEAPVKDDTVPAPVENVAEEEAREEVAATAAPAAADEEEDEDGGEDDVEDNETEEAKEARLAAIESAPELENNQRYNRSFKARLIQSSDAVKEWYELVKDAALSYKGTRSSLSWRQEKIYKGRALFAKIALRGKTLSIYFPVSVSSVKNIEVEDVSDKAVHAATPALLRIKKDVHARQALELVAMSAAKLGLEAGKAYKSDKREYALRTTEQLIEDGLVKVVTVKG